VDTGDRSMAKQNRPSLATTSFLLHIPLEQLTGARENRCSLISLNNSWPLGIAHNLVDIVIQFKTILLIIFYPFVVRFIEKILFSILL
jgi:hypothetical protein